MGARPEMQELTIPATKSRSATKTRKDGARSRNSDTHGGREAAALRLLGAERSEEIFPILLEEIVNSGYPRALVLEVNFESGEVKPKAALNCSKPFQQQCSSSLWANENPLVATLNSMQPAIVPKPNASGLLYCHPIRYTNRTICWEAERDRRHD